MPELNFKGKEFVYNHHLTVPFRPLLPQAEKGVGAPALDGNLIIHGDNLHGLKALLPTHAGKVDCIFIDPPYNTGNEGWCYNDNVNSPMIREWLATNPIGLEDGLRHDKWLSMMWPRLRLLHELLAEDGSLWVTLDDNEIQNARAILDEIFGEHNFVAVCIWQKMFSPKNTAQYFSEDHDYVLVYAKNAGIWRPKALERTPEMEARYTNPDNDGRGPWLSGALQARNFYSKGQYEVVSPSGDKFRNPPGTFWRFSKENFDRLDSENRIWWGEKGSNVPRLKRFLTEVQSGRVPQTLWTYHEVGHSQEAKVELTAIFSEPDAEIFVTPKPTRLLQRVLELATSENSLVLDSFAGSGTTAHAVLAANARDGGNRQFILVEGEDYADSLTAERVRRVINGYEFTGTQRDELLREPLTFSKLKQANSLLEQVQRIETLDGPKYDKIAKTVKDGGLIVTGERAVKERTKGLGGSFTFCELGAPIDMDGLLTGADLPDAGAMAALLYHTATAQAFNPASLLPVPAIGEGVMQLGLANGRTLWLIYKPDLDWLKSSEAALSLSRARAIAKHSAGEHLVFAPAKFVSRELLAAEKLPVEFAPLPFALYRVETA